jgi:hypothetical protein
MTKWKNTFSDATGDCIPCKKKINFMHAGARQSTPLMIQYPQDRSMPANLLESNAGTYLWSAQICDTELSLRGNKQISLLVRALLGIAEYQWLCWLKSSWSKISDTPSSIIHAHAGKAA